MVKKSGTTVFGAVLTSSEKRAMNMEIQRQLIDYEKKHRKEISSTILWHLHTQLGLGPKRLKRFYEEFIESMNGLNHRYLDYDMDAIFVCTKLLKDYGIDLDEWEEEINERR